MPDLSVVTPMYRTGRLFPELHRRLCAVLDARGTTFELIAVDDACPEGSGDVAARIAAADARVQVVRHARNLGQQRAVLHGLRRAGGEVVVVIDADLQDVPEDIPLLLDVLARQGADAVFAGRRGMYQSVPRMITSRAFKRTLSMLLGVPHDAGSFVALSRRMVRTMTAYDGPHPYLLALVGGTGLPAISVPVPRAERPVGRSAYTTMGRVRFASRAFRTALAMRAQRGTR